MGELVVVECAAAKGRAHSVRVVQWGPEPADKAPDCEFRLSSAAGWWTALLEHPGSTGQHGGRCYIDR